MRRLAFLLLLAGCVDDAPAGGVLRGAGTVGAGDATPAPGGDGGRGGRAPLRDAVVPRPDPCEGDADEDGFGDGANCAGPDCDDANRNIHPDAFEACNGLDDDCDGRVDEGLFDQVCGVGACQVSVANCADGRPQRCVPAEPTPEQCNTIDDDCDGVVDEGVGATSCGVGACERQSPCVDGAPAECVPGEPAPETCDGTDEDCDGSVDEGFRASVHDVSYGNELRARHAVCDGGGERLGPNCNAAMSRWCGARGCTATGFGPVENSGDRATVTCVATDAVRQVSFAELAQHHAPCNGAPERIGANCNAAIHRWCAAQGFASGFGPVESGPDFVIAACLRAGPATPVGTTYSTLRGHHDGCDGAGQRIGPHCNAAIHRFCQSRGHASGYGPAEHSGDDLLVVCVSP